MRLKKLVRERFPCVAPSWRKYIYGVVYVPSAAEQHLVTLKSEGGAAFLRELHNQSSLGSAWASAFLGYQSLLLKDDGTRDIDGAIELCRRPAASGDPYAAYILGWATYLRGDRSEAIAHFRVATRKLFPPAVVDLASLVWRFKPDGQAESVLTSLQLASSVGHCEAPLMRYAIYRTGKLGFRRRLVGYMLTPLAYLYVLVTSLLDPFSAQVFTFNPKTPARALGLRP